MTRQKTDNTKKAKAKKRRARSKTNISSAPFSTNKTGTTVDQVRGRRRGTAAPAAASSSNRGRYDFPNI